MPLARAHTRTIIGIDAIPVVVETHISGGLPKFNIVGLNSSSENKERVRSAIINCNFKFPASRITVNLSPADIPKEGGNFDLSIAISILAATGQIDQNLIEQFEFNAELGLSGELKPIPVILPHALALWRLKNSPSRHSTQTKKHSNKNPVIPRLIVAEENTFAASLCDPENVTGHRHLLEVTNYFTKTENTSNSSTYKKNQQPQKSPQNHRARNTVSADTIKEPKKTPDLSDIVGQNLAKRALIIAAAGGHSLLLIGAPGVGKTMLASCLTELLPPISEESALEVACIYACSRHGFQEQKWRQRPFRSPHHTCSHQALVGGSRPPQPGEISLAHRGVLFLDELPEFSRSSLEALREPLEAGSITISRAAIQTQYPAKFQLIAAMNPCPCGYAGSRTQTCRCNSGNIQRYLNKISGPLLDRIDIKITMAEPTFKQLISNKAYNKNKNREPCSKEAKKNITACQTIQYQRQSCLNSQLNSENHRNHLALAKEQQNFIQQAIRKTSFSNRHGHRLLKVALTIADLDKSPRILNHHIAEAINITSSIISPPALQRG